MKNVFIYLIGFPGTGKYTTALEIKKQDDNFRVVDNHLINNVLFTLLDKTISERVWKKIGAIWDIVLETMARDAAKDSSFIMTNVLMESNKSDKKFFRRVMKTAQKRGATFIPVRLTCNAATLEQRIVNPERALRRKLRDPEVARRLMATDAVMTIKHPNLLTLDTTNFSVAETATAILEHAQQCVK